MELSVLILLCKALDFESRFRSSVAHRWRGGGQYGGWHNGARQDGGCRIGGSSAMCGGCELAFPDEVDHLIYLFFLVVEVQRLHATLEVGCGETFCPVNGNTSYITLVAICVEYETIVVYLPILVN